MNEMAVPRPNNLDAFWMPYTDNRYFKAHPRMLARAEGMSYFTPEGREVLDATAGLWCCNAGHGRREITEAIQRQAAVLDFAPTFQLGHPIASRRRRAWRRCCPKGWTACFSPTPAARAPTRR
jgi:beta-alanine--pyruvate transaminase